MGSSKEGWAWPQTPNSRPHARIARAPAALATGAPILTALPGSPTFAARTDPLRGRSRTVLCQQRLEPRVLTDRVPARVEPQRVDTEV